MKKIIVILLVLAVMLMFVNLSMAAWNQKAHKSSPLFKKSLNETKDRFAGKSKRSTGDNSLMGNTLAAGCNIINKPETAQPICETYENTCEGNYTCYPMGTCQGGYTCYSTCNQSTCSGDTCSSTCSGGTCQYHYIWRGDNYWHYNGGSGKNWYQLQYSGAQYIGNAWTKIVFKGNNPPPTEMSSWYPDDGHYGIDKWYEDEITNHYDVSSHVLMKMMACDPWTEYIAVTHVHSPPDDSGIYINVHFYFYDW